LKQTLFINILNYNLKTKIGVILVLAVASTTTILKNYNNTN